MKRRANGFNPPALSSKGAGGGPLSPWRGGRSRIRVSMSCAPAFLLLPVLLSFGPFHSTSAQTPKEYQIKAVLLYNLTRFVDWPDSSFAKPDSPIKIGILGRDPFGPVLDEVVKGESVNGRKIVIERFATVSELRPVHLLFIAADQAPYLEQIFRKIKGWQVLTVSEMQDFTRDGGMLRLYLNEHNKVRLRVNLDAVRAENLRLSSKLLQVAELRGGRE